MNRRTQFLVPVSQTFTSITLVILLPLFARSSTAQQSRDTSIASLENIVVTATRTERSARDIPTSVTVIGRQEIDASPARTVDDLIMNKAGISVKRVVGIGEGVPSDISMRGVPGAYTAARVLVLVDGIPTNVSGAPFLVLNQVPNEMIQRVEIIKGPFSGLYGSNAFNGVVNIITRSPGTRPAAKVFTEFWPNLFWGFGGFGGFHTDRLSVSAGGGLRSVGNYFGKDSAMTDGQVHKVRNRDYRDERFMGKADFWITDRLKATVQARYFNSELGYGTTSTLPQEDINTGGKVMLGAPSLTFAPTEKLRIQAGGYARRLIGTFHNETFVADSSRVLATQWTAIDDDGQATVQADLKTGPHRLTFGADYLYNKIEFEPTNIRASGSPINTGTTNAVSDLGVYVQDEISILDGLTILPGLRLDNNSLTGPTLSPKIATGYLFSDRVKVRASAGRGFRAPSLVELYMPEFVLPSNTKIRPNADTKPEHIWAVDGGGDFYLFKIATISVTLFYNNMNDLISPWIVSVENLLSGNPTGVLSYRNVSRAWSKGLELDAKVLAHKNLTVSANYTFTASEEVNTGEPLDYVPRHKAGLTLAPHFQFGPVVLSAELGEMYLGKRQFLNWQGLSRPEDVRQTGAGMGYPAAGYLDGIFRTDASVRVGAFNSRVWLSVAGTNLTDQIYQEHGGVDAPGRMITIKLGGGF